MKSTKFKKGMIFLIDGKIANPVADYGYYLIIGVREDSLDIVKLSTENIGTVVPIVFNNHIDYIRTDIIYNINNPIVKMEQFRGILDGSESELDELIDLIYGLHWCDIIPIIKVQTMTSYCEYCNKFYSEFGKYPKYKKPVKNATNSVYGRMLNNHSEKYGTSIFIDHSRDKAVRNEKACQLFDHGLIARDVTEWSDNELVSFKMFVCDVDDDIFKLRATGLKTLESLNKLIYYVINEIHYRDL